MTQFARIARLIFAVRVMVCLSTGLLAAPAPAGQSCPNGSYVTGSGFSSATIVIFQGVKYKTTVNQEGTLLNATLPTRDLDFGVYAITISNGPGMETTSKKALQIY